MFSKTVIHLHQVGSGGLVLFVSFFYSSIPVGEVGRETPYEAQKCIFPVSLMLQTYQLEVPFSPFHNTADITLFFPAP